MLRVGVGIAAAIAACVLAVASAPAAEYAPHWYENGKLIVGSVRVETRGKMGFEPPSSDPSASFIRCHNVIADWTLTNPSTGEAGTGELTMLTADDCRGRPRCSGATVSFGGLPTRAPLEGKSHVKESLEGMSMGAECSTGGFGGEYGYLYVEVTRSRMSLFAYFYGCNPHEYPICSYHPAIAAGKLFLPGNITAK